MVIPQIPHVVEGGTRMEDIDDDGDSTYMPESESESESDIVSDFEYFAESDSLSDTCDPIGDEFEHMNNFKQVENCETDCCNVEVYENENQSDPETLLSPQNSDDEMIVGVRFPEFDEERDMSNPKLSIGLRFVNVTVFRKAIREYAIRAGFELKFLKNEKCRVTAVCKEPNCRWRIHGSLVGSSTAFQVKSLRGEPHICPRKFKSVTVNATYLANRYLQQFVDDAEMSLKTFKTKVRKEVMVYANRQQLYRAKVKAIQKIQGNVKHQYKKIRKYCCKVLESNPGSTAIVKVEGPPIYALPTFQRLFMMYPAQKNGFLEGCRPIIGLDACFLKGAYGGQLMAAIGRDGNNQMFPIAVAVVECECKDSWNWFLQILINALGIDERKLTFISDRQKGLVETFQQMLPEVEHRYCVRHLYANFKRTFSDGALKDLMWAAARSYEEAGYIKNMNSIREKNQAAYLWLKKVPPEMWCKFKMSPYSKCDMLCNNLCESFNNFIKEAREQPILTLLETLRRQFMCRFQKKAEWIGNYSGILCPRIQKKVDQNKLKSLDFEALKAGGGIWEIMSGSSSYVVDLERHKCSCREWDLTGIPCIHATCACLEDHKQPEWYVNSYYMVSKYKVAYSGIIHPVGDHNSWEFTEADSVMPPPYKRQPGRPKKARRRGPDEINNGNKVNKQGSSISCSNCGDKSHNKRSCKKPPSEKPMKKKNEQVTDLTDNVSRTVFAQTNEPFLTLSNESGGVGCSNNRGNRGRGRGRGRGKSKGKRPANGPQCGIGNWNGIGFFNMHNFIPANQEINRQGGQSNTPVQTSMWNSYTGPPTIPHYVTTSNPPQKSHIQRQASRYGDVFFSSQSSSNNFAVIRDGYEEFEFTGWGEK